MLVLSLPTNRDWRLPLFHTHSHAHAHVHTHTRTHVHTHTYTYTYTYTRTRVHTCPSPSPRVQVPAGPTPPAPTPLLSAPAPPGTSTSGSSGVVSPDPGPAPSPACTHCALALPQQPPLLTTVPTLTPTQRQDRLMALLRCVAVELQAGGQGGPGGPGRAPAARVQLWPDLVLTEEGAGPTRGAGDAGGASTGSGPPAARRRGRRMAQVWASPPGMDTGVDVEGLLGPEDTHRVRFGATPAAPGPGATAATVAAATAAAATAAAATAAQAGLPREGLVDPEGQDPEASNAGDAAHTSLLQRIAQVRRNTQDICARINALIGASVALGVPAPHLPPLAPSPELDLRVAAALGAAAPEPWPSSAVAAAAATATRGAQGAPPLSPQVAEGPPVEWGAGESPGPAPAGHPQAGGQQLPGPLPPRRQDARAVQRRAQLEGVAALCMPPWLVGRVVACVVSGASDHVEAWWAQAGGEAGCKPAPREPLVGLLCAAECNRVGTCVLPAGQYTAGGARRCAAPHTPRPRTHTPSLLACRVPLPPAACLWQPLPRPPAFPSTHPSNHMPIPTHPSTQAPLLSTWCLCACGALHSPPPHPPTGLEQALRAVAVSKATALCHHLHTMNTSMVTQQSRGPGSHAPTRAHALPPASHEALAECTAALNRVVETLNWVVPVPARGGAACSLEPVCRGRQGWGCGGRCLGVLAPLPPLPLPSMTVCLPLIHWTAMPRCPIVCPQSHL